ncbi:MAG TPA: cytochrome b/b6 domain-containing protein [Lentimicrobium sp.]|nr:cytochrome b/b6 domain-containing protein [Lentimicrobium sp.]
MQENNIYLYPIWVRLWHASNAIFILLLIFSGISMQYASAESPFIRFNIAVQIHNISGILLTAFYLMFIVGNLVTGNGKYYRIKIKGYINDLLKQARYYAYGMFRGESSPFPINKERKFNPIQKLTYVAVMYFFLPILFITGWALLFPETIATSFLKLGGITLTSVFHAAIGFFVSLFLIIHIYFCTVGLTPFSNFRSMVNGYHETHN